MKQVDVSDEAYAVISRHASANGESLLWAMDELTSAADKVWVMEIPEMKGVWAEFKKYYKSLPPFEGMI